MVNKECPICYEKLGKLYRELECGHRYHLKCIAFYEKLKNQKDLNCPYCRKSYSNMKLRERTYKLTSEEEIKKSEFVSSLIYLMNEIEGKSKNKKIIIINNIYNNILSNAEMLKDRKFGFEKFVPVMIHKVGELSLDLSNIYNDKKISKKQYDIFENNKNKIESLF
jgi:hypothetical protein